MLPAYLEELISQLEKLPGIGIRSAQRIAFHLLESPNLEAKRLADAIILMKEKLRLCKLCHNLSEADICTICNNVHRQKDIICVVQEPKDVLAIERAGGFNGLYFVLGAKLSPLEGINPQDLNIQPLLERLKNDSIKEIIIATDSDSDGELTALFLTKQIKPFNIKISRIGQGIPVGGNIEYADSATLARALESRREIS